tara:strand:+ start:972 stop:1352 length:381 start_codon:yes stop_codon:yes gene_type:complete
MKPLLKKNNRVFLLKKNSSFKKIFSDGLAFSSGLIILNARFDSPEKNFVFLGFAVSKKPAFNSVQKNRVKRLLKEAVIKNISFIGENVPAGSYVVFFNGSRVPRSLSDLKDVLAAFKKVLLNRGDT